MDMGRSANTVFRERNRWHQPPDELTQAIGLFNDGKFRQCCNSLEFLSLHEPRLEKNLYQGIIQLALALSARQEADFRGTIRLLRAAAQLLQHVAPVSQQVDVAGLIHQTEQLRETLEALGMERMHEVPAEVIPHIRVVD